MTPGTRIGPYEILSLIGKGGMGEVYRARDTRLKRDVALKVLPAAFANDVERMARFQREAEVLASLNHPNIAHIYGVEERAIAMELVEGETLHGPLPLETALEYAGQIAQALEAAHDKGIIHRDLKPANVKITPDGVVKVLDFGLAKALDDEPAAAGDASESPTLTLGATRAGMIMGTAAYMAPEQASGKAADRRADVWSFGAVLYEMLSGKRPFPGHSVSDTLATVLKLEPDWELLPASTPAAIRTLIQRCLVKERRQRLQAIGEARIAIETAQKGEPAPAPQEESRRRPWPWIAATILLALALPAAWFLKPAPKSVLPLLQLEISAPEGAHLVPIGTSDPDGTLLALSPDGRRLVFFAIGADGKRALWLRNFETGATTALPGTDGATGSVPFWSPDSRWVAFIGNGKLRKVNVAGGQPEAICDAAALTGNLAGAWNPDGVILLTQAGKALQRVSSSGGMPVLVFPLDQSRGETGQRDPYFLPGGKLFLYHSSAKQSGIWLGSLDGKTRRFLLEETDSPASYVPNPGGGAGWMLYILSGQLFARPFDPDQGAFTGEAAVIATSQSGGPSWSASPGGMLAFRRGGAAPSQLVWLGRDGKQLGVLGDTGALDSPRISPDQKTIVFARTDGGNEDVWLYDVSRNTSTRFTFEPSYDQNPIWSPDSRGVIYFSYRQSDRVLVERPANGIGAETILLKAANGIQTLPTSVSRDGKWVVVIDADEGGELRMALVPRPAGPSRIPLFEGHHERDGSISPDGRWLVYSALPGSRREIFVQSLPKEAGGSPSATGRFQISTAGGSQPMWRADGKEIFYIAPDGKLMAVPVESGENFFRPGAPQVLFQTRLPADAFLREYDVTPDGRRFLLNQPLAEAGETPITVIVNWPQLLKN